MKTLKWMWLQESAKEGNAELFDSPDAALTTLSNRIHGARGATPSPAEIWEDAERIGFRLAVVEVRIEIKAVMEPRDQRAA